MIKNKEQIQAVIFDWGGVCCKEGEPFASLYLQRQLALTAEQIAEQSRDIYNGYYTGQYDRDGFWRAVIKHFNLKEDAQINSAALSDAYLHSYEIYPEVLAVAERLKTKYRVCLLSNLTSEMRDYIRQKHETAKYFDPELYSCDADIQMMKPERGIYQILLDRIKVPALNCLFIDNSLKNIKAAENLGFQTIFFENVSQFLNEIQPLL